ncbi:MAG: prolyl oligopeptidase family serine peptidase, partial [Dehalococcoidia bacterium]
MMFRYPQARRSDQVDDYHGTTVADPYRWLEDPDSPESRAWIDAENALTASFQEAIPQRERLKQRLTELWNYEKFGLPSRHGDRYFIAKNDGLQNQSVLYSMPSLGAEPRVLLDPNARSPDGTIALSGTAITEDGSLLAYGLSASGSDWQEWHVRDVGTGEDRADHLKWIKFSGASWTPDGHGFFYSRYDEPNQQTMLEDTNYFQKLCYHRVGTVQSEDLLVYERSDRKEWGFHGGVTDDGRFLIVHVTRGTDPSNQIFYKELTVPSAPVVELLAGFDASYLFIGNEGPVFWFRTDLEAPRGRVIEIDIRKAEPGQWREIIPQSSDTLEGLSLFGDQFIASYLQDAHSEVRLFDLAGQHTGNVLLPGLGTVQGFEGKRGVTETFYAFTSFITAAVIYRYDLQTGESTLFRRPEVAFNPDEYESRQVFYPSKDGTRVPMFITHKRGLRLDGSNPTYLYGYGGFRIPLTPAFSLGALVWMEMGGIYAVANLRGGGEYGEAWHKAGT